MQPRETRREETIRVDRQIVNLLSRATYESFPRVLRELVSNSYDADATRVSIEADVDKKHILVTDNGNGMSPEQFSYFLTIAATMRMPRPSPRYHRERIGQFGVGFLAAFPFCEELVVETTASASPTLITATIPSASYLRQRQTEAEFPLEPVESIGVPVFEVFDRRLARDHYTRILLKGLTPLALQYLQRSGGRASTRSVRSRPAMERLKWDLQDTLVLDYPPDSPVGSVLGQRPVGIEVYLNEERLFRNPPPGEILETHKEQGAKDGLRIDGLRIRYVITSPWEPVHPVELRGLRIRVNNVGVGPRESFGLAVQAGTLPRLYWLSGDVYIDEGGRDYLALNREGFTNAPVVDALHDHFRAALRRVETRVSQMDTKLKELEAELGVRVRGGGPRPKLPVGSKRELVERRIDELKDAGFTVERLPAVGRPSRQARRDKERSREAGAKPPLEAQPRLVHDPIEIDRPARVIRIFEEHPDFRDTLTTSLGKFSLEYREWDYATSLYPACELKDGNVIRVNSNYPLFRSRAYGRLFLRIAITVTVMTAGTKEKRDLARDILLGWLHEFRDLLD